MNDKDYKLWEQETIITYNQLEDTTNIYTHDQRLQSHIEKVLGVKPYMKEGKARGGQIKKSKVSVGA